MRPLHRVPLALIALQAAVQAMLLAAFVAGVNRWLVTGGRAGVARPRALDWFDPSLDEPPEGVLDVGVLRSAPNWLDVGPAATAQTWLALAVAPVLAGLVLVAGRSKAVAAVAAAVGLQALAGPAGLGALFEPLAMAVAAAALLGWWRTAPDRPAAPLSKPYTIAAAVVAGLVVLQQACLGWYVNGVGRYVTADPGAVVYNPIQYSLATFGESEFAVIQFVLVPVAALALIGVAALTRRRVAVRWAAAILAGAALGPVLVVLGVTRPPVAAAHELVTFGVFAVALRSAVPTGSRRRDKAEPVPG